MRGSSSWSKEIIFFKECPTIVAISLRISRWLQQNFRNLHMLPVVEGIDGGAERSGAREKWQKVLCAIFLCFAPLV